MNQTQRPVLGVLGGLGPMATAHFMELVIRMTQAETDQQHLDMIIYNIPSTPDRTDYLLGRTQESPLPHLLRSGRALVRNGASHIAVPCVTAHAFLSQLQADLGIPVIDGVGETAAYLANLGITRAGILATDGTLATGLFHSELAKFGISPIVPGKIGQTAVMDMIYRDIKAGRLPDKARFDAVCLELWNHGAQAIILGCTELSLIKRDLSIGTGFLDVMEVLAQKAITACGKEINADYKSLI